jgi:tetratricopeptide (TPR) repeat protein
MGLNTHNEPTPEFNERCLVLVQRWENGDLPFEDVVNTLNAYRQEAIAAGQIVNEARAEQMLGYVQHYRGNLTISIQHWERARHHYQQVGNRNRVATIDLNLGESYRYKGDFNRSIRLYRAAYETAELFGDVRLQTIAVLNEGLVLVALQQNADAHEAFKRGLALAAQCDANDPTLPGVLCELHHGMAVVALADDDIETAWEQALMAYDIAQEEGQPLQLGFANRTMGEVLTVMQQVSAPDLPSDPDVYFRAALAAFQEINAETETARTLYAQALSLAKRGRRIVAARMLQQVMIEFSHLGMVDDAARAAEAQLQVVS